MKRTLEEHGARHLARELARFDHWAETDLLENNCNSQDEYNGWLAREKCRERRLAVAMYLDTRDRNSRSTLIQVSNTGKFRRHCRELVEAYPPSNGDRVGVAKFEAAP